MPEIINQPMELTGKAECWLPRSARSPGRARQLLTNLLARVIDGERFASDGLTVLTELTLNAVRHGSPGGCLIWVYLDADADRLLIEVHDASSAPPEPREPGPDDEAGRGLILVNALSAQWGWRPRGDQGIGKITWAVVTSSDGGSVPHQGEPGGAR
ncbi:ATP-binding protein [Kitasatospora sp. NPDC052896]|uniref:ATP-binding protein n=1 Tax=Kitasatospora sp. NPDC052896 TaxID=3364061 RepID=UPI0037CB674F